MKINFFKHLISAFVVGIIYTACAQNKKTKNKTMDTAITANNIVEKIYKNVKHYELEPRYFMRVANSNCTYEILVNDILVKKEYELDQYATPTSIDCEILKSGVQTVTVRLYPLGNAIQRAYGGDEKPVTSLLHKTKMKIEIVHYEAYNISNGLNQEKQVLVHEAPTKKDKFIGAGLPYYEYKFTFKAEVPYDLEGWTTGEDLTQFDQDKLKKQVVEYYQKIKSIYENKDKDALAQLVYKDYLIIAQTKYWGKEDIQQAWEEAKEKLNFNIIEYGNKGSFSDYDLQLYGNGKLATLKHSSHHLIDQRVRGESGFWFKYKKDNIINGRFTWYHLYVPKGQPLTALRALD